MTGALHILSDSTSSNIFFTSLTTFWSSCKTSTTSFPVFSLQAKMTLAMRSATPPGEVSRSAVIGNLHPFGATCLRRTCMHGVRIFDILTCSSEALVFSTSCVLFLVFQDHLVSFPSFFARRARVSCIVAFHHPSHRLARAHLIVFVHLFDTIEDVFQQDGECLSVPRSFFA